MNTMIIVGLGTLTVSFAIAYSVTLYKITKINQAFTKLFISHESLQEFITKNNVEFKNDSDIHKENFIKFLSDSRDWAYQYIEDVQAGLQKFTDDIKPEIDYFNSYGDFTSMQPNYYSLKKISEAYDELLKLLPKEEVK